MKANISADSKSGQDEYLALVDTLPPTLLAEAPTALLHLQQSTSNPTEFPSHSAVSVFASRITFLSEFRDYLLFLSQDARDRAAGRVVSLLTSGIAPVGFWAVLLVESIRLLEGTPFDSFADRKSKGLILMMYRF